MDKNQKVEFVSSFRSALVDAGLVIVARQSGLTVEQSTSLRNKMRDAGASYKVAKNTLARLAIKGLPCDVITDQLSGPVAIAYSKDPVSAAKILSKFMGEVEEGKLSIVCGALGSNLLNAAAVNQLAKLPSLDELRGKIVGLLQAPATKVAGVVQAPAGQLARVFAAYAKK